MCPVTLRDKQLNHAFKNVFTHSHVIPKPYSIWNIFLHGTKVFGFFCFLKLELTSLKKDTKTPIVIRAVHTNQYTTLSHLKIYDIDLSKEKTKIS